MLENYDFIAHIQQNKEQTIVNPEPHIKLNKGGPHIKLNKGGPHIKLNKGGPHI